jgi:protoheme IX farnesyltransferase
VAAVSTLADRAPADRAPGVGEAAGHAKGEAPLRPTVIREVVTPRTRPKVVFRAYLALTKPRIVELLLVTTVPAMLLARHRVPSLWLMLVTLVGGALAAGAANALNCYIDRDIDPLMRRTSKRPLPAHTIAPRSALVFGLTLAVVSVALMAAFTNLLAAGLTAIAIAYYDLVYTMWLKRTTPANTFWGGVCGAMPVLIGWAAVTGSLAWPAWAMFAVVFLWQPPHFWALAITCKDDYARAGIPMLPVVATLRRVGFEMVIYTWLTLAASLALWALGMSLVYGVTAVVVGALFVLEAHRVYARARRGQPVKPMRMFHWSTTYLTILSIAISVDALIH